MEPQSGDQPAAIETTPPPPRMPWEHRKEIGRFKAYWKTVFHVIGTMGRLETEMAGPVDIKASAKFVGMMALPIILAMMSVLVLMIFLAHAGDTSARSHIQGALMHFLVLSFGMALPLKLPAVASWFFMPRRLEESDQERGLALTHYAFSPLALSSILMFPLALAGILILVLSPSDQPAPVQYAWIAAGLCLLCELAAEATSFVILMVASRRIVRRSVGGTAAVGAGMLAAWIGMCITFMLFIPAMAMWPLMVSSLD